MSSCSTYPNTLVKKGSNSKDLDCDDDSLATMPLRSLLKDEIAPSHHPGLKPQSATGMSTNSTPENFGRETANKFIMFPLAPNPKMHVPPGHYDTLRAGKALHRDLSEDNLVLSFVANEVKGVVNAWDTAKFEGSNDSTSSTHRRAGTSTFMAIDLLADMDSGHFFRYDLESFFYVFLWAAIHNDPKQRKELREVHPALKAWTSSDMSVNAGSKELFMISPLSYKDVYGAVKEEFKEIEKTLIKPLHDLFCDALISRSLALRCGTANYDFATCGGVLTFHTFMEATNVKPRWVKSAN